MGLDTTHNAFHGAYSSFNRFRCVVCEAIGGSFPPHYNKELVARDWYWWAGEHAKNAFGFGSETHPGLDEFLAHSDCDGEISPQMCVLVARDLEQVLPLVRNMVGDGFGEGHILARGGYVAVLQSFIDGCKLAAERGEPLEFH